MNPIQRRQGKSIFSQRFIGWDLGSKDETAGIGIIFDEEEKILKNFPVPIIKSGEIFTYSTEFKEAQE